MHIETPRNLKEYELLDSGNGMKLERFGAFVLSRPDPNAIWNPLYPALWKKADAIFHKEKKAGSHWENLRVVSPWHFSYETITMELRLSPFKHTGLFPEQAANWKWFGDLIAEAKREVRVLNLFGYTGGASLYAAAHGAHVTHVDASKPSIQWAKENQRLSGLEDAPIRWILDDALAFVQREVRRGSTYDAVIMDPPSFGRDPKGKVFKFEEQVPQLLALIKKLLVPQPLFALINSYAMGYSAEVIKNLLAEILPLDRITCGELHLEETKSKRHLPCSVFARYS